MEHAAENDAPVAWWASWYHSPDDHPRFEYHGPWWVSGYDGTDRYVIVAAVPAETEEAAWALILDRYDNPPEGFDRRFCDQITGEGAIGPDAPWTGPAGRFPRAEWMRWPSVIPPGEGA